MMIGLELSDRRMRTTTTTLSGARISMSRHLASVPEKRRRLSQRSWGGAE